MAVFAIPLLVAFLAALMALWAAATLPLLLARLRAGRAPPGQGGGVVFAFRRGHLATASDGAIALAGDQQTLDPPSIATLLDRQIAGAREAVLALIDAGRPFVLREIGGGTERLLRGRRRGGHAIVEYRERATDPGKIAVPRSELAENERELALLRSAAEDGPALVWVQEPGGAVTWANRAYRALAPGDKAGCWPLPALFDQILPTPAPSAARRVRLRADGKSHWFHVTAHVRAGGGVISFALPADETVQAEAALRNFVQTLTKTFAVLSTGLAIFDRERRLALFNPALADLTGIEPEWLSRRPSLALFLDRLRERRMIPEPRDYRAWREQITRLEAETARGRYDEQWNLPGGPTYRVTGRPHAEGAIALTFDDISTEVSLQRRFRAELALGQCVLDTVRAPVGVIDASGALTICNAAYRKLTALDPDATLGQVTITDVTRALARALGPDPAWGELRDYVRTSEARTEWSVDLGGGPSLRVQPVPGPATVMWIEGDDAGPRATGPATPKRSERA